MRRIIIIIAIIAGYSNIYAQTIQEVIDLANPGDEIIISEGTYEESLFINKSLTLTSSGNVILNVAGNTTGILIQNGTTDVTISGLVIVGDDLTGSGITVSPGTENITIENNSIENILLPGGGNASPLSYGILCWGDSSPIDPPTNITIQGNSITNVLGSAISLGSDTENVLIEGNSFSNINPVDIGTGTDTSIGVQAELSNGLIITNNSYNNLVISNNLINCTNTDISSNEYNNSSLMLSTTYPHAVMMSDAPWWSVTYTADMMSFYELYYNDPLDPIFLYFTSLGFSQNSSNLGCTDSTACNYDSTANTLDESCTYAETYYDCDGACLNDIDGDGVCNELEIEGCTDSTALNYDSEASDDNGSCMYQITQDNIFTAVDDWVNNPTQTTVTYGHISTWDVSNVTNMSGLFLDKLSFNDDIGNWDVSNVTQMASIFSNAQSFNQDIGGWNVSNVTNMYKIFAGTPFNQDIGDWNVSNVTNMHEAFLASDFNQDIGNWDVSNVTDMYRIFCEASVFNQDIGDWDVSNVTDMHNIFHNAYDFNQNISCWDISAMDFSNSPVGPFNTLSFSGTSMSTENYDALLIKWSSLDLANNVEFSISSSYFCGSNARDYIINNYGWTFNDNGYDQSNGSSCEEEGMSDCNVDCLNDLDGDDVCDENEIVGCIDETACNYNTNATDNGYCEYALYCDFCSGATNGTGYIITGGINEDGDCYFQVGCDDETACNYNSYVTFNNNSCIYPQEYVNCDGNCINDLDNDFICDELDNCPEDYNPNQEDFNSDNEGDACDGIGLNEELTDKKLIKVTDILGRDFNVDSKQSILLYIYDDGSIDKKYLIK